MNSILLKNGADPCIADYDKITPLHAAASSGRVDIVEELLNNKNKKVDLNAKDKNDVTPLLVAVNHVAAKLQKYRRKKIMADMQSENEVVSYIRNKLASKDKNKWIVPYTAIVKLLIEAGANVSDRSNVKALLHAASTGCEEIVDVLVKHGADVNAYDEDSGRSVLHAAVHSDSVNIIKSILASKTKVNTEVKDSDGDTPLQVALIAALQVHASKLVDKRKSNLFNLQRFIKKQNSIDAAKLLVAYGADLKPNVVRNNSDIPLMFMAASVGDKELVTLMLDKGADINSSGRTGEIPVQAAIQGENLEMVTLLVAKGSNLDHKDKNGDRPLDEAIRIGNIDIVKFLIDKMKKRN